MRKLKEKFKKRRRAHEKIYSKCWKERAKKESSPCLTESTPG
jgi:hypothetical protein